MIIISISLSSLVTSALLVVHHVPNTESTATDDDQNEQDNDDKHTATSASGFLTGCRRLATVANVALLFFDTVGTGANLLGIVLLNHGLVSVTEVSSREHTSS